MGSDSEPESKRWWQTLPGLLTATAGIITALTGLLLAVHQIGCFSRALPPAAQTQSHPNGESSLPTQAESAKPHSATGSSTSRQLILPSNTEVRSDEYVYKLLSARLEPYAPGKVSLRFTVRMSNNGRFDANFWGASFRLLVDESLQAPTNNMDEIVASHSAKEAEVEFVIPETVSAVGLQMGDVGEGKPTIPLSLQKSQP